MTTTPMTTAALLVTEPEAGKLLAVCSKTIANLAARGELHPVYVGTPGRAGKRYSVDELRLYVANKMATARTGQSSEPSGASNPSAVTAEARP
jgi:hypothetical protein